jgi:leucyl-tRNA synthetase
VWTADYVLMGYGTGAIMAVPAQDERDFEFAETFGLDIVRTVQPPAEFDGKAYTGDGPAINSGFLDGHGKDRRQARSSTGSRPRGKGSGKVNFKLRDWLFSRQRYWGEPFPIVYDDRGHHHPWARSPAGHAPPDGRLPARRERRAAAAARARRPTG